MSQKSLRYQDEKSDKFWSIALADCSHTVTYGRYGTEGQNQTKDFPTAAAALKSYEKLVDEKLKKGYLEDGTAVATASPNATASTTPSKKSKPSKAPREASALVTPVAKATTNLQVERKLHLKAEDWLWATWRTNHDSPKVTAGTLELPVSQKRLLQAIGTYDDYQWAIADTQKANVLCRQETRFWRSAMTMAELADTRQQLEAKLDLSQWPTQHLMTAPPILFYLAADFGCPSLQKLVESWSDQHFLDPSWRSDFYQRPQEIILGLGTAELVEQQFRRLQLPLGAPGQPRKAGSFLGTEPYLRGWLAHTEFSALDYVGSSIISRGSKQEAESLAQEFATCVIAPEAAPIMLEVMLFSKAPQVARQWLKDHPAEAIAGLIPIATGKGKTATAALTFLQSMKRQGYQDFIQTCLTEASPEVATKIRATILDVEEKEYMPFDEQSTPAWLQAALENQRKPKRSWKISVLELPPITLGDRQFNAAQIAGLLDALSQSKAGQPEPLIPLLKAHVDSTILDRFAWQLFEIWLTNGAVAKENWAMLAVGWLGNDTSALKLTPLVRAWPGESQHKRAVLGLECLRAIGTDLALMQIHSISQKIKFQALKARAQDCMEAIAKDRKITADQLADRIIPDCDLDEKGQRIFDFGGRKFHFVMGGDLKPMLRDPNGKKMTTLPKPNSQDDGALAEQAIADWKLMKKQISDVAKIHSLRLEAAMVRGRTWSWSEFETLLLRHPLMTHLVQQIIWATYDDQGHLQGTFRVVEDRSFADNRDRPCQPDTGATVGIPHPLALSDETKSLWGEIIGDYEIIQPFAQMSRDTHALLAAEEKEEEIKRFATIPIPGVMLARMMENQGWLRGGLHDHGDYSVHYKYFGRANVTAIVGDYETMHVEQAYIGEDAKMTGCVFLSGACATPYDYPGASNLYRSDPAEKILKLGTVDRTVLSEVLRDLSAIANAAEAAGK